MPVVTDAIRSGHRLMKTIRVFISSTGDVQRERHLAIRAIRSIAAEYNVPVSTSRSNFQRLVEENGEPKTESEDLGLLLLWPYFLEYHSLLPDGASKVAIPNTARLDV